jgi:hypothetical protein
MWLVDPLSGNGQETHNEITAVPRQQPARNKGSIVRSVDFYVVRSLAI